MNGLKHKNSGNSLLRLYGAILNDAFLLTAAEMDTYHKALLQICFRP